MATVADDFNRANGAPGANWTVRGGGTWGITSNILYMTAGSAYQILAYTGAALASTNYSVQALVSSHSGVVGRGPVGRIPAGTAVTGYGVIIFGGDTCYLVEITAGGEQILDTGTISIVAGTAYTVRLECEGTSIRGYINGTLDLSVTDASLTGPGVGLLAYDPASTATTSRWDDFTASDLATPTLYLPSGPRMHPAILAR